MMMMMVVMMMILNTSIFTLIKLSVTEGQSDGQTQRVIEMLRCEMALHYFPFPTTPNSAVPTLLFCSYFIKEKGGVSVDKLDRII